MKMDARTVAVSLFAGCLAACKASLPSEGEVADAHRVRLQPFLPTQVIEVGGHKTRYTDSGAGRSTLLLLHGFPETLQGWRRLAPELSDEYRVIAPDLLGAGRSAKPSMEYSPWKVADHVVQLLDKLRVEQVHLVGVDTGVFVAVAIAEQYPTRVRKLVLGAGSIYPDDVTSWEVSLMKVPVVGEIGMWNPFTGMVVTGALKKGYRDPSLLTNEIHREYMDALYAPGARTAALSVLRTFSASSKILDQRLSFVRSPTAVVFASHDAYFPRQSGERLASRLPRAKFTIVNNCGHFIQEERPKEFAKVIKDHLRPDGDAKEQ